MWDNKGEIVDYVIKESPARRYEQIRQLEVGKSVLYHWKFFSGRNINDPFHSLRSVVHIYSKRVGYKYRVSKRAEGVYVSRLT